MANNDCPECTRLREIEARLSQYPLLPEGVGPDQLVEDADWLIAQVRYFQQWAAKVVALEEHIEHVEICGEVEKPRQILFNLLQTSIKELRAAYDALFKGKA